MDRRIIFDLSAAKPRHEFADHPLARTATLSRARRIHDSRRAALAVGDAGTDRAFGDAVAVANLSLGRHLVECDLLAWRPEIEHERQALFGERRIAIEGLHEVSGLA